MHHFRPPVLLAVLLLAGCGLVKKGPTGSLADARKGFQTKLVRKSPPKEPVETPPAKVFTLVKYDAPVGQLAAYLTPDPGDGQKHPAIVWITGGDCNSIGDVWSRATPDDDQTAAQYRQAGVVMMFPSLRGGNDNPGQREGFLGEVDDVLAAADYLAKQPYVDPARVYLGGHSTGGTLALLVAECSGRFRAVFSFGPVDDVSGYGPDNVWTPFDVRSDREAAVRSPGRWLADVTSPTFVFEGTSRGNIDSLKAMASDSKNPNLHFYPVRGATHFSVLAPVNRFLAEKVLKDDGPTCNIAMTGAEVTSAARAR
jgi:acetyl esterase/lipase